MDNKESDEVLKKLLERVVGLYTKGTLQQYGLKDEQALEIVSNVSGVPQEKLKQIKEARKDDEGVKKTFETLYNML